MNRHLTAKCCTCQPHDKSHAAMRASGLCLPGQPFKILHNIATCWTWTVRPALLLARAQPSWLGNHSPIEFIYMNLQQANACPCWQNRIADIRRPQLSFRSFREEISRFVCEASSWQDPWFSVVNLSHFESVCLLALLVVLQILGIFHQKNAESGSASCQRVPSATVQNRSMMEHGCENKTALVIIWVCRFFSWEIWISLECLVFHAACQLGLCALSKAQRCLWDPWGSGENPAVPSANSAHLQLWLA